jgi:hypothetical protein
LSASHPFVIKPLADSEHLLLVAPGPADGWALDYDQALALSRELAAQVLLLKSRQTTYAVKPRESSNPDDERRFRGDDYDK